MHESTKKQVITTIVVVFAAFLMALNNKTFVNTGRLYPGGVIGLTILIQRVFDLLMGVKVPFSVVNILLNSIPVYDTSKSSGFTAADQRGTDSS